MVDWESHLTRTLQTTRSSIRILPTRLTSDIVIETTTNTWGPVPPDKQTELVIWFVCILNKQKWYDSNNHFSLLISEYLLLVLVYIWPGVGGPPEEGFLNNSGPILWFVCICTITNTLEDWRVCKLNVNGFTETWQFYLLLCLLKESATSIQVCEPWEL